MEKQEQEELKSRRNVAAKQGQRTRQKDCEERERDGEGKRKREGSWKEGGRESVPQGRANAAFTFHLSRGHNLLQQGSELALNSIKATEAATSVDPRSQSTAQLASLPGSHVGSGF